MVRWLDEPMVLQKQAEGTWDGYVKGAAVRWPVSWFTGRHHRQQSCWHGSQKDKVQSFGDISVKPHRLKAF